MYCKYSEPFWIDCNRKTFNRNTDTNNYQMIWTGMYSLSCEPIMLSLLSYSCLIEIKSFYRAVSNQDISCPWTGSDVPAMCVGSRTDTQKYTRQEVLLTYYKYIWLCTLFSIFGGKQFPRKSSSLQNVIQIMEQMYRFFIRHVMNLINVFFFI